MAARGGKGPQRRASPGGRRAVALSFHSQQAAEKAIKAFLTFRQIAFRKTHDLSDLGVQCAALDPTLESTLRDAEELTDYASAFRYPDSPYEPDAAEAAQALTLAARLGEEIRQRIAASGTF